MANASRDVVMYKVDALRGNLDAAVELLADTVIRPAFTADEMAEAAVTTQYQIMDMEADPMLRIGDLAHQAAYGDSPLGRNPFCPVDRLGAITVDDLRSYMDAFYTAPRMVLAGAGVEHDELVELADKFFADVRTTSESPVIVPDSPYLGTACHANTGSDATLDMVTFSLAFPAGGWITEDLVPACVLDVLLGGGSAFSVGGPGKGMYSRLYREMLNQHAWIESANAFSAQTTDRGLFGIQAAAPVDFASGLLNLICFQLARLAENEVDESELARARNQLRSSVMMNLENRAILAEDIGRQIISAGHRIPTAGLCARIDAVTAADLMALSRKMMSSRPSLAAIGPWDGTPAFEDIAAFFRKQQS